MGQPGLAVADVAGVLASGRRSGVLPDSPRRSSGESELLRGQLSLSSSSCSGRPPFLHVRQRQERILDLGAEAFFVRLLQPGAGRRPDDVRGRLLRPVLTLRLLPRLPAHRPSPSDLGRRGARAGRGGGDGGSVLRSAPRQGGLHQVWQKGTVVCGGRRRVC